MPLTITYKVQQFDDGYIIYISSLFRVPKMRIVGKIEMISNSNLIKNSIVDIYGININHIKDIRINSDNITEIRVSLNADLFMYCE